MVPGEAEEVEENESTGAPPDGIVDECGTGMPLDMYCQSGFAFVCIGHDPYSEDASMAELQERSDGGKDGDSCQSIVPD